ncbi:hypothetical protein WQ53_06910 [Pseudoxanthomonas suwonensis]|uniref:Uncharacterized protein n=2 Tax=Pseudoxanthomonas suwonensis TaxID=314722 RepID=A0A0E3UMR4_9GAMM|nr:hypothetical protein WQ53_06910 [Pseudoxanthomonas suwonensis]
MTGRQGIETGCRLPRHGIRPDHERDRPIARAEPTMAPRAPGRADDRHAFRDRYGHSDCRSHKPRKASFLPGS